MRLRAERAVPHKQQAVYGPPPKTVNRKRCTPSSRVIGRSGNYTKILKGKPIWVPARNWEKPVKPFGLSFICVSGQFLEQQLEQSASIGASVGWQQSQCRTTLASLLRRSPKLPENYSPRNVCWVQAELWAKLTANRLSVRVAAGSKGTSAAATLALARPSSRALCTDSESRGTPRQIHFSQSVLAGKHRTPPVLSCVLMSESQRATGVAWQTLQQPHAFD